MPLPKVARSIEPRRILLSANGVAEAVGIHHETVLRELLQGGIEAEAWVDHRGKLRPLFLPSVAIVLARRLPPSDLPPTIV